MRPLHRLVLLALATLSAAGLSACGDQAGEERIGTVTGEGFTVDMPGDPRRQTQTVPTAAGPVLLTAYVTQGGEKGFSLSVAKIPATVKGDLDGAVQGAATNVKGMAKDTVKTTYQGFPARDTRITNAQDTDGHKGTVFARMILAKDRLFQLQFVQDGANVKSPPAAYPTFLASLKIG